MPIKFSDLARETKGAVLTLDSGDAIHFEFRHSMVTPQFMHTLLALGTAAEASPAEQVAAIDAVSEQVAALLTEWDVVEDDGVTMIPLTVARLKHFPYLLQLAILQTCLLEMAPGESSAPAVNGRSPSRPASGATSSPTARSARRQTGTRS